MKSFIAASFLLSIIGTPIAMAQEEVPSIDDSNQALDDAVAKYNHDTDLFNQVMQELRTNDFWGGRVITVPFRGKTYTIDRSAEPLWYKKTVNPPKPNLAGLLGLIGNGKAAGNLNLRITVTYRDTDPDGTVHEEIWQIDSGAFLEAQISMDEAKSKQHK